MLNRKCEFTDLWNEYEAGVTLEAQFVKAIDKMQAFAQNEGYYYESDEIQGDQT